MLLSNRYVDKEVLYFSFYKLVDHFIVQESNPVHQEAAVFAGGAEIFSNLQL